MKFLAAMPSGLEGGDPGNRLVKVRILPSQQLNAPKYLQGCTIGANLLIEQSKIKSH